jgi:hypothetical protein
MLLVLVLFRADADECCLIVGRVTAALGERLYKIEAILPSAKRHSVRVLCVVGGVSAFGCCD